MRDIKFRAWDTSGRIILYLTFSRTPLGYIHKFTNYEYGVRALMQFTGVYDKNGKDIFEGDILSVEEGNNNMALWEVVWDFNGFFLKRYATKGVADPGVFGMRDDLEVIGNIYENPELLRR